MRNLWSLAALGAVLAGCSQQNDPVAPKAERSMAVLAKAEDGPAVIPASAQHPVVLELYQSQGCSSCPPANANVNKLAARPEVLALSFAVTYWDRLGWKDRFATPAYTQRQRDYADAGGRGRVYTPQIIVNGGAPIVGDNAAEIGKILAERGAPQGGPSLAVTSQRVEIGAGKAPRPAIVWLVRYDPRTVNVAIATGENSGRTLPHRNIVRQLVNIGQWTGKARSLPLPQPRDPNWRTAILLQDGTGGRILGAARA